METLTAPKELDLVLVNWPFCLMELKSALKGLNPGQLLEVKVSDPVVLATMKQVLDSSSDQVISSREEGPCYVLTVQKGLEPGRKDLPCFRTEENS
jgi:TusA-related sulfurtransferase